MLKNLRSKIVHSKMFIHRAMSWVSIANAGMLLFLVLSQLENYGVDIKMETWFLPIFIFTVIVMITLGYLEDRLGFHEEERRVSERRSPQLKEINERLQRIEKKLK